MEFITRRMHVIGSFFKGYVKKRIPFGYIMDKLRLSNNNRVIRFLPETKDGANRDEIDN